MNNNEKIIQYADNIGQLSADIRYFTNINRIDLLDVKLDSIEEWVKSIKRIIKKRKGE